ncbi:hypothetical protein JCM8097_000410 [Rhodosporidiobolus ruineniae]
MHDMAEDKVQSVHPAKPAPPTSTPLSILDNTCAHFFRFAAAKLYRAASPDPFGSDDLLRQSLSLVLSAYPHFAGRLRLARPDDGGEEYRRRYGRAWVDYGQGEDQDPGVELVFSSSSKTLDSLLPSSNEVGVGISDATNLQRTGIYPPENAVVLLRPVPNEGVNLAIKVTRFSCGGTALGFRMSHALGDASVLSRFATDWADVHRQLFRGIAREDVPLPVRPFGPALVDSHALGDLNSAAADPAIEEEYIASLPRSTYDAWTPHPSAPPESGPIPPVELDALDDASGRPRGAPLPWHTWDYSAPVSLRTVSLSAADLSRIHHRALAFSNGERVSVHDALVAHFWRLSLRARADKVSPEKTIVLTPAVGVRARLDPPLDPSTVGSIFVLLASRVPFSTLISEEGTAAAALAIRSAIASATPRALGALLHHHAHELDPMRVHPSFCGDENVSMSSWIGAGSYDADFGAGRPVLAEGTLPDVDNMLLFEEEPVTEENERLKWHERGARVRLAVREEVMERVLADPELRG